MSSIFAWISNVIYAYGISCAGMASQHGAYEAPIPEKLKLLYEEK